MHKNNKTKYKKVQGRRVGYKSNMEQRVSIDHAQMGILALLRRLGEMEETILILNLAM